MANHRKTELEKRLSYVRRQARYYVKLVDQLEERVKLENRDEWYSELEGGMKHE